MANVAVVQGSSQGIGLAITKYLLKNSNLNVISTTSKDPNKLNKKIINELKTENKDDKFEEEKIRSRLTNFKLDVSDESSVENVSRSVEDKFGKNLRLLINVSGVLLAEKSITKINHDDMKKTFAINTFGHLLTYKHFFRLLPNQSQLKSDNGSGDPAKGLIKPNLNVLLSLSARVGSIADNSLGGWYSYRASKSAINQIIVTLQREINLKKSLSPTVTIGYHPGTVIGTELSKQFVNPNLSNENKQKKEGLHPPDVAVEKLFKVLSGLNSNDGGSFLDYSGKQIPW